MIEYSSLSYFGKSRLEFSVEVSEVRSLAENLSCREVRRIH